MADFADEGQRLRERAKAAVASLLAARSAIDESLERLALTAPSLLPSGLGLDDTFVPTARDDHRRGQGMVELISVEVADGTRTESLEVALTMLDTVMESTSNLHEGINTAARGFFEAVSLAMGGPAEKGASAAVVSVGRLLDDARRHLDEIKRSLPELKRDVRIFVGKVRWNALLEVGDREVIERLMLEVIRAEGRFDDLAARAGLDAELAEALPEFLLSLALRLESEIADSARPVAAPHDDGEPAREPNDDAIPLIIKLTTPDPVGLGDEFDVVLTLRNDRMSAVRLETVEIDHGFLRGFELVSVVPEPAQIQGFDLGETLTAEYGELVLPAAAVRIKLTLRARVLGNYSGEISVWTHDVEVSTVVPNVDVVLRQ